MNVERSAPRGAVFLSYASQDVEAVKRICEALRVAGIEVWFDQSELVGGDAWDAKIRGQIGTCALFLPVVSANTQARLEGYFRLEWKLAAQRTHLMADEKTFMLPIVIDDTRDTDAKVPAEFKSVQWTRLPAGETPPAFVARVRKVLSGEPFGNAQGRQGAGSREHVAGVVDPGRSPASARQATTGPSRPPWLIPGIAATLVVAGVGAWIALRSPPASSLPPPVSDGVARPVPPAPPAPGGSNGPALSASNRPAAPVPAGPKASPEVEGYLVQLRRILDDYAKGVLGRSNLELGDQLAQKALQVEPFNAEVLALSARVSVAMNRQRYDLSQARRDLYLSQSAKAIKLAPDLPAAQFAYADVLRLESSGRAEAEKILRGLVARFPHDQVILLKLSSVVAQQGEGPESRALVEQAIQLDPESTSALLARSSLLRNDGKLDEAERVIDGLLAREPNETAYIRKFNFMLERVDPDEIRRVLNGLPAALRREENVANWAAALWLGLRDTERMREMLALIPGDYFATTFFAGPKALFEAYAFALERKPEAARTKWAEALQVADREWRQEPDSLEALAAKALCLAHLDRKPEAEEALRVLQQMRGRLQHRLPVLVALGRGDEALLQLRTVLQGGGPLRAASERSGVRALIRFHPEFDALRNDPRLHRMLLRGQADRPAEAEALPKKPGK